MKNKKSYSYEPRDGKIVRLEEDPSDRLEITAERNEIEKADSEAAFENFRQKREEATIKRRVYITSAVTLFLLAVIFILFLFLTRITDLNITGSDMYSSDEIEEKMENILGKNYFLYGKGQIAEDICEAYPLLEDISVGFTLPGRVDITVRDGAAEYAIMLDGEYLILTDKLRITGVTEAIPRGVTELVRGGIKSAMTGKYLEFENETDLAYIQGIIACLKAHEINENIVRIDVSEKFDVKLKYGDRFIINVGNCKELDTRLDLAVEYIKTLREEQKGYIDASGTEVGSFREAESIE